MSSAEYFDSSDEGQSRHRKDLPQSPAKGAGGAAEGGPLFGQGDRSELVPDIRQDNGNPQPRKRRPDGPISSVTGDDISSFTPHVPPAGEQPAPGDGSGSGNGPGDTNRKSTGGFGEQDPDAPDETSDAADEFLRELTTSGFAGEVLFEDKRGTEDKPPVVEEFEKEDMRLPADFTALVSEIERNRERLQEIAPLSGSEDVEIIPREDVADNEVYAQERQRALRATDGAVQEMERFALDLIEEKATEWWGEYDVRKEVYIPMQTADQDGGVRIHIKQKDISEQTDEASPLLTWQNGAAPSGVDRRLTIETVRRDQQYDDPQNFDYPQTATIGTVLLYDLLATGEVHFVGMGLKYLDEKDLPNDEAADTFLNVYRDSASEHGITGEEADDVFTVSRTLSEMVKAYPVYKETFGKITAAEIREPKNLDVVITTDDQVSGQEASKEIAERDIAVNYARRGILTRMRELMATQDQKSLSSEAATTGEAVIAMMELNAKREREAPKVFRGTQTLEEELAALDSAAAPTQEKQVAASIITGLEKLPGVPLETLAKAYLIDGSIFQGEDSQFKLNSMLGQEKERRLDPRKAGPENAEARKPELLEAVIKESAILGIDPQDLITYAVDEDEAWRLRAYYYNTVRLKKDGEDSRLDAHLFSLTDRNKTSAELAYQYTTIALETSDNPALNIALLQQFPEVARRIEITVHNVDKLFNVAHQVLMATTAEMLLDEGNITVVKEGEISELESEKTTLAGKFDELIDDLRRSPKGDYDDRPALIAALREGQFIWRMSLKAIKGDDPGEIVDAVKEEGLSGNERNAVLDTVATQYAAHGDFENAQKILGHIHYAEKDTSVIESAYINVWNRATSVEDLQQVKPLDQETGIPISPLLSADYIAVGALVRGNMSVMRRVALDTAADLQKGGATEQELAHREQQLNMLEQFIIRTQAVAGKEDKQKGFDAAVALSRELFAVFTKEGTTADIDEIEPIVDVLVKNGDANDWRNIQTLIASQPISDIEKIKLYAKFAFEIE